jgi:hypothetical protein
MIAGADRLRAWLAFLAVVPLIAGVCCTRLRFSAAVKSISGGGVMIYTHRPRRKQCPNS